MRSLLNNTNAAALAATTVRPVFLADITFSNGTIYAWNGLGNLSWNSQTYAGLGNLVSVSTFEETNELKATELRFSLSGVNTALLADALQYISYGLPAILRMGFLDITAGTLVSDPLILRQGLVDNAQVSEDGSTATIVISAEDRLISLQTPKNRRLTSADQNQAYPADRGFDFVPILQTQVIQWGQGVTK